MIVFVVNQLAHGGAETQVARVAEGLSRRGWRVGVVCLGKLKAHGDALRAAGVTLLHVGMQGYADVPRAASALRRFLREQRAQVTIGFLFNADILNRIISRLAGVPVVMSSIRNENIGGRWRERVLRWTDGLTALALTNSTTVARNFDASGAISRHPLKVVPNALDIAGFLGATRARPETRATLGAADGDFVWLAVGAQRDQKNYRGLIRAFSRLPQAGSSWLWIAGERFQNAELEALARELGVGERVLLLGARPDVPDLLAAADAFVLASGHEGLPSSVIEAQSSGLAVVATAVGGVEEIVRDGAGGYIVPAADNNALLAAMQKLMALDPEDRRRMGELGRDNMHRIFDSAQVLPQWEVLIGDACREKSVDPASLRLEAAMRDGA